MKSMLSLVAVAALAVVITGCSRPNPTAVNHTEEAVQKGTPKVVVDKRIVKDHGLQGRVDFIQLIRAERDDKSIVAQATVHNFMRSMQRVQYRVQWYDKDGVYIETPQDRWIIRHIEGGDSIPIKSVSPSPAAIDFKIKLQGLKR